MGEELPGLALIGATAASNHGKHPIQPILQPPRGQKQQYDWLYSS